MRGIWRYESSAAEPGRRVAETLLANIRELDTAARLGGDEFAVLLSVTYAGTALTIGERIRNAILDSDDADRLTLSIGIVELPPDTAIDLNAAFAAADRAMYDSKDHGGNCVSIGTLAVGRARHRIRPAWPRVSDLVDT
jgi:diguanylate cyclase (GGDEF)-like protein